MQRYVALFARTCFSEIQQISINVSCFFNPPNRAMYYIISWQCRPVQNSGPFSHPPFVEQMAAIIQSGFSATWVCHVWLISDHLAVTCDGRNATFKRTVEQQGFSMYFRYLWGRRLLTWGNNAKNQPVVPSGWSSYCWEKKTLKFGWCFWFIVREKHYSFAKIVRLMRQVNKVIACYPAQKVKKILQWKLLIWISASYEFCQLDIMVAFIL